MLSAKQRWEIAQEEARILREANEKPAFFGAFNEYVAKFPDGEHWRHMVDRGQFLIATYEHQSCLEGDYYIVWIRRFFNHSLKQYTHPTHVVINNGDDGYYEKPVTSDDEAQQEIANLKLLAPFHGSDLLEFGYVSA